MTERTDQLEQHRTDADLEEERAQAPRRASEPLGGESPSPDQPADVERVDQGQDIGDVYRSGS